MRPNNGRGQCFILYLRPFTRSSWLYVGKSWAPLCLMCNIMYPIYVVWQFLRRIAACSETFFFILKQISGRPIRSGYYSSNNIVLSSIYFFLVNILDLL